MISESLSPARTVAPGAEDVTTIATTIGIRALARNVSAVVGDVVASGLPVVLTKHGRPVAAIVPIERVVG